MSELNLPRLGPNRFIVRHPETGRPVSGGSVKFYLAGTDTPKTAYYDRRGEDEAPNPLNLAADGGVEAFLNGAYRIDVYDGPSGTGEIIWSFDQVNSIAVELEDGNPGSLIINNNLSDLGNVVAARQALELVKQSSTSDAISGRVMTVGAFGLGGINAIAVPNDDADDAANSGIYNCNNVTANLPAGASYGTMLVASRTTERLWQIYAETTGSAQKGLHWRERTGAGWSDWYEIAHSGNSLILGDTASDARSTLGLGTAALLTAGGAGGSVRTNSENDGRFLRRGQSLADIDSASDGRSNLGLGTMSTLNAGSAGTQFRTNSENSAVFLRRDQNLSDIDSASAGRSNLGLGSVATRQTGNGSTEIRDNAAADSRYHISGSDTLDMDDMPTNAAAQNWVASRISEFSLAKLGSYAFLARLSGAKITPGDTISGANLKYAAIGDEGSSNNVHTHTDSPPGTWMAVGGSDVGGSNANATMFLRVA